jgi:hypothetical protein
VCDWVCFSVGDVWVARSCVPGCVLRACGCVRAVRFAQCVLSLLCGTSCKRAGLLFACVRCCENVKNVAVVSCAHCEHADDIYSACLERALPALSRAQ